MKLFYRPPFLDDPAFKEWEKRAVSARDALDPARPPERFNVSIWQDFKKHFLVRLKRCAYCEGRYIAGEFGDAEHYRPKGEVTEGRKGIEHPGYFWLAYEWHNLLLSCKKCNSSHADYDSSEPPKGHPGKLCEFPVRAARITRPSGDPEKWIDELLAEEPLLLNPYFDDPCDHFEAVKDGWLWHKTERGKATIEVCHLNRQELREERVQAEENVKTRANSIWTAQAYAPVTWDQARFGPQAEFSTYLNCKLREELERLARGYDALLAQSRSTAGDRGAPPR
jgi:hypothetical protein